MSISEKWTGQIFNNCKILNPINENKASCIDKFEMLCYCGTKFISTPRSFKRGNAKSCGCLAIESSIKNGHKKLQPDNYNKLYNNLIIIKPVNESKNGRTGKWYIKCHCGIEFISTPSEIYCNKIISCGCLQDLARRNTLFEYHKKTRRSKGLDENKYLTDVMLLVRECVFNPVKPLILELDSYTCNLCFKKKEYLNVHHIESIKKDFNVLNKESYYKIYDIDNLITLCHDCHKYTAHLGHGKLTDPEIQNTLKVTTSMRFANKSILERYTAIVKLQLEPWIEKYVASCYSDSVGMRE